LAGDEGGHGCAVTVVVVPGGCYAFDHVASFEDCTGQVRVVAIDTGVDDGDYDPFSAGNSVDLLNAKEAQMPLRITDRIGIGRTWTADYAYYQ